MSGRSTRSTPKAARTAVPADDVAEQLLGQFRMLLSAVKAHFQAVERASGMGGAQVWALSVISQQPGIGVGELAQALNVRQPTASNLMKVLVDAGMVEVTRNAEDRRLSHLHVTPYGLERLSQVPGPMSGVLPDALRRLDPACARELRDRMEELLALMDVDPAAASQPLAKL